MIFSQYSILFGQQIQTYTLALAVSILLSIVWLVLSAPEGQVSASFDTCLAGLIAAIMLGRLFHVALNWVYFGENPQMMSRIHEQGGLDWHGAILGAFLAGALMAKFRGLKPSDFLLRVSPILPLIAFAGWYGAAAAGSAYGLPIERMADYPAFFTWIERDIYGLVAPRFAVQPLGMAWTALLFMLAILLQWRSLFQRRRLPLILLLLCIGTFALGFLRGDYALIFAALRAEQWLDVIFGGFSLLVLLRGMKIE
jgi:prolipoprotein diacylglyceryltransferase